MSWIVYGGHSSRAPGPFVRLHLLAIALSNIWHGINSPAFPIIGLLNTLGESIYLFLVALLWWTIGSAIDSRKGLRQFPSQARQTVFAICTLLWGAVILAIAVYIFGGVIHDPYPLPLGWFKVMYLSQLSGYALQVLWAIILFTEAISKLSRSYAARLRSEVPRNA